MIFKGDDYHFWARITKARFRVAKLGHCLTGEATSIMEEDEAFLLLVSLVDHALLAQYSHATNTAAIWKQLRDRYEDIPLNEIMDCRRIIYGTECTGYNNAEYVKNMGDAFYKLACAKRPVSENEEKECLIFGLRNHYREYFVIYMTNFNNLTSCQLMRQIQDLPPPEEPKVAERTVPRQAISRNHQAITKIRGQRRRWSRKRLGGGRRL